MVAVRSPEAIWRDEDARAHRRWATSFAIVLALHAAPVALAVWWLGPVNITAAPPPSAIMIEMAPMPAAPPAPPTEIPPGPEQKRVEAVKPPQSVKVPRLPRVPKAAVALATNHEPEQRRPEDKPPVAQTTAPPTAAATPAPAAAPAASATADATMTAPNWQGLLLGQLERFKRYPADAQARRQQGVAYLRFTMNRDGRVLTFRLEKSSGYDSLDQEALALIQRAQPLPKPPPSVVGDPLELVVPIQFFLTRR
jgi:protein TonB